MNKFQDMISSADGSVSAMRVMCFLIVAAFLFNWCYLTVKTGQSQPLNWDQITLVLGALAAKAAQRPFETKPENPPTQPKVNP